MEIKGEEERVLQCERERKGRRDEEPQGDV